MSAMRWRRSPVRRLLSKDDEARVIAAIRSAEAATSGEIRVHVERWSGGAPLEAARRWFDRLGMRGTRERNGILFYIAVDERAFAVVGDDGIHQKVGPEFWEALRDILRKAFSEKDHAGGLVHAIAEAGVQLSTHFPRRADDRNELTDTVSF